MARDYSVDILKFLAVFLIINSHMDALYVKYDMLATGGAIGDCLFLFCSGYTLLLSKRELRFDNWYKRRINRIYPSVIVCALVGCLLTMRGSLKVLALGGGEFVSAIMIYYVLIYVVKKTALNRIPLILLLTAFVSLVVYIFFFPYKYETSSKGMYGTTTLYRWIPYFGFMLLGSWTGLKRDALRFRPVLDFLLLIVSGLLFYGIQLMAKMVHDFAPFQIVTLIPLAGIVYYLYKWCHAEFWRKLYNNRYWHAIIMTIGGVCLESYLIQFSVFTTKMNSIFPLNLPIMVVLVLIVSFICKCLARVFSQTFSERDYQWKEVFRAYL